MKKVTVGIDEPILLGKPYPLGVKYSDYLSNSSGEFLNENIFAFPLDNENLGIVFIGREKKSEIEYKNIKFKFTNKVFEEEIFSKEIKLKQIEKESSYLIAYPFLGVVFCVLVYLLFNKVKIKYVSYKQQKVFKSYVINNDFRSILSLETINDDKYERISSFLRANINKKTWDTKGLEDYEALKEELYNV